MAVVSLKVVSSEKFCLLILCFFPPYILFFKKNNMRILANLSLSFYLQLKVGEYWTDWKISEQQKPPDRNWTTLAAFEVVWLLQVDHKHLFFMFWVKMIAIIKPTWRINRNPVGSSMFYGFIFSFLLIICKGSSGCSCSSLLFSPINGPCIVTAQFPLWIFVYWGEFRVVGSPK